MYCVGKALSLFLDYSSSDDSDNGQRTRGLSTIDEMPNTVQPAKSEPPIDVTYESGLDLISARLVGTCVGAMNFSVTFVKNY